MLPVFNLNTLSGFVKAFSEHSEKFVNDLESRLDKGNFDIFPLVHQTAMAMICGMPFENLYKTALSETVFELSLFL